MRLKRCKSCGKNFETDKTWIYLCPECALAAKRGSVIRQRICKTCGRSFNGGPRAWYCPECRAERKKVRQKTVRPLGSIDVCTICGSEYTVTSGRQKYCPACKDEATRQAILPQKRDYHHQNREYVIAHKAEMRKDNKVCVICGSVFDTDIPTVTCSEACANVQKYRWQAEADLKRGKRKSRPVK